MGGVSKAFELTRQPVVKICWDFKMPPIRNSLFSEEFMSFLASDAFCFMFHLLPTDG